ncbi:alpha/beta fold hydrolase [Streptococcus macacae]|uniref:Hydrolase, alpha/beta domain protein n=1 Tax=Streptococcus macacae NCTC 11558 TaxID=764298 RepID=G5JUU8_9STRE|nr:alpha/beta hydrolase [Streptococcus macacae]EHJ51568.1 hydrolase, alpha/beta domain protein [Streptococcus macacae NCTC 11558]SUN78912.1 alpha/beta fold family hydrolase [Streptococcus macacae NCTC 11558]
MVFTGNKQFDFQIERFTSPFTADKEVLEDRKTIGRHIKDFESWHQWWQSRAHHYEKAGKLKIASSYYKAAMFYLTLEDSEREDLYQSFLRTFYASFTDFDYEKDQVPYESGFLPTLLLKNAQAQRTLLVMGGFDGFLEEIASFFTIMKNTNYNILIFDGPGQGNTISQGLHFTPDFHKPVSAILDYFHLNSVDAIGLSWGGFLVMEAAAFEKRIRKVIAMDIFYSSMDIFKMNLGKGSFYGLSALLHLKAKPIVNHLINKRAKKAIDLRWELNNGYMLTGETNPYDLLLNLKRHNSRQYLPKITQDCLLLVGKEDHYVPYTRIADILLGLTSARSIQANLFTKESGGEQHCQFGHMDLAFNEIKHFLN